MAKRNSGLNSFELSLSTVAGIRSGTLPVVLGLMIAWKG
jgi:hypothetical protein